MTGLNWPLFGLTLWRVVAYRPDPVVTEMLRRQHRAFAWNWVRALPRPTMIDDADSPDHLIALAFRLRAIRTATGETQGQLSDRLGIPKPEIALAETNPQRLTYRAFCRLRDAVAEITP